MAQLFRRSLVLEKVLSRHCVNSTASLLAQNSVASTSLSSSYLRSFPWQPFQQQRFYRVPVDFPNKTPKPTPAEVENRVFQAIKTFDRLPQDKPLSLETHFMNDLGLDSLDHVEIVMAVEKEFAIEIPDEQAEKLVTPKLICEYLQANVESEENIYSKMIYEIKPVK